jgi:hypothetical protein
MAIERGGACAIILGEIPHFTSLKNFHCHPMVWVCWMLTELFSRLKKHGKEGHEMAIKQGEGGKK